MPLRPQQNVQKAEYDSGLCSLQSTKDNSVRCSLRNEGMIDTRRVVD